MTRERRIDAIAAVIVLATALVMFLAARREPAALFDPLGPGTAPMAVAIALALLALILLARALIGLRVGQSSQALILGMEGGAPAEYRLRPGLAWFAFAATAAYVGALQLAWPFLWSTMAFLAVLGVATGRRTRGHVLIALAVAVLGALAIDLLFRRILLVQLS